VAQAGNGDHAMAGYLVEEVLDAQQPAVRRLLLSTSILDRVNAEIAADLTESAVDGEFSELVEQNAFIRPLGQGWYRYHQIFRDVLRLRLRHENPGQTATLHRRAASWFSARGLLTEAVQHATAAQDWQLACELVVEQLAVGDLLGLRPAPLLVAALGRIPDHTCSEGLEPALIAAALALAGGDESACRSALARADAFLADRHEGDADAARLTAALVRLMQARAHEEVGVRAAAADVERLIARMPHDLVKGRAEVCSVALLGRAVTELWAGWWSQASDSLTAAASAAVEAGSVSLRLDALAHGALVEGLRGRWGRATELVVQAAQLSHPPAAAAGSRMAVLAVARAFIALERYQLVEARREVDQAGPALLGLSHPLLAAVRGLASARIDLAAGHEDRAGETLRRIGTGSATPPWLIRRLMLTEAEVHFAARAPVASWQAAIRAGGAHTADGAVVMARVQLGAGRAAAALGTLRPALADALAVRSDVRVEAWLLDAQSSYAVGNPSRGRRSLDRALRLGDRDQIRLPFAALSPWLRSVLRSDQELARRYSRLLEPLRIGVGQRADRAGPQDNGPLLSRQLSDRELEVLRHLAQMRTSEEIAAEMFVSINTVKTHLKSIYRKLAVTRRGDAVRRAHQLDLLVSARVPQQRSEPPEPADGSEQAQLPGPADGIGAGGHSELAVDQPGVALDRVHGDE
jgi:LuxR family maltose regulon positive regulatory protein